VQAVQSCLARKPEDAHMTKLTTTQRALLAAAAETTDGVARMPVTVSANKANGTINALIKAGFLVSKPRGKNGRQLLITTAGRKAVSAPGGKQRKGGGGTPASTQTKAASRIAKTPAAPVERQPRGKLGIVVGLLRRPDGVGIAELQAATGWQAHSIRGAIASAVKKKLGLTVSSTATQSGRVYHIVEGGAA
jgi:uncharacterized protein DUF3489